MNQSGFNKPGSKKKAHSENNGKTRGEKACRETPAQPDWRGGKKKKKAKEDEALNLIGE